METNDIKYCKGCNDEIYPDVDGDYFCMDCNYAFIVDSHPSLPTGQWTRFKQ